MTVGNTELNALSLMSFSGVGYAPDYSGVANTQSFGPYRSRVWNGGDSSQTSLLNKVPAGPIGMRSIASRGPSVYTHTDKKGVAHYKREKVIREVPIWPPRKPRKKRALEPHQYSCTYRSDVYQPVYREDWDGYRRIVAIAECEAVLPGIPASEHYKLLEKLRRKAYGSGWNPGIFLAEMPQAIRMISNAATRIHDGLVAARKGSWRGVVRNVLGGINPGKGSRAYRAWISYRQGKIGLSALWLELQYGWYPLVGDIEDAAAYIGWAVGAGDYKPTRLKAQREMRLVTVKYPSSWAITHTKVLSHIKMQYVITNLQAKPITNLPSVASAAAVAWERLPWSFVGDWIIPVSSYLQALRTASDLRGTVVLTVTRTDTQTEPAHNPGFVKKWWDAGSGLQSKFVRTTVLRTVTSEISPPTPLPDLSPDSVYKNWERAVNSVALLAQYSLGKAYRWHTPIG